MLYLHRVNYPLLPTREVHVSVVGLIEAATKKEVEDPVVRKCLINLLNILWKKLRADPVQTEFFFLHADSMIIRKNGSGRTSDYSLHASSSQANEVSELVLFTGLLPHMYAMGKVGEKCREALVIAAAVHEKALCRFILQLTPFCHYAINGVISAFDNLPKTLPDGLSRGGTVLSPTSSSRKGIENELYLIAIRLRFCCTLAMVARYELTEKDDETGLETRTSIANELLLQFRARFLEGPLLEGLLNTSEASARTATLYARIILEELVACCSDTSANPLLYVYIQFLLQQKPGEDEQGVSIEQSTAEGDSSAAAVELSPAQMLPTELLHRMDSLSSSLSIATIDLFTYLMELRDEAVDAALLGELDERDQVRRRSSSTLSPVNANGAIWFATRFPNSAVASNVHLWKIQAFDGMNGEIDIPAADDNSEDQVLSLLSYIADAEYAACQRAPAAIEDSDTSDDETDAEDELSAVVSAKPTSENDSDKNTKATPSPTAERRSDASSKATSRTAATRNSMKPLREVYLTLNLPSFSPVTPEFERQRSLSNGQSKKKQSASSAAGVGGELPLFIRVVFNRLERVLENSFYENLALSGLVAAIALKQRCAPVVFDVDEKRPAGQSVRSILEDVYSDALRRIDRLPNGESRLLEIRRKLVDDDNEASLNDHEAETRLLCGFIVLDEILKELCSVLFAKERVRNLPLKPEGYYLEPKRSMSPASRKISTDTNFSETSSCGGLFSPTSSPANMNGGAGGFGDVGGEPKKQNSIGKEFELLLAEAESSIESILQSDRAKTDDNAASEASVDAVIEAIAATEFR